MPRPGRREEIVEAAASLFAALGYHGTSVRRIADAVSMQSGSVYAHFASKEALCLEIVRQGAAGYMAAVVPVAEAPLPAARRLRLAVRAHVAVTLGSPARSVVFLHEWTALDAPARDQVRAWRDAYEALWRGIIEDGIRSGDFAVPDPAVARFTVLAAASGPTGWYAARGRLAADAVGDAVAELCLCALGAAEDRREVAVGAAGGRAH